MTLSKLGVGGVIDVIGTVGAVYLLDICVSRDRKWAVAACCQLPLLMPAAADGSLTDGWMNILLIDVADNWPDVPTPPPPVSTTAKKKNTQFEL